MLLLALSPTSSSLSYVNTNTPGQTQEGLDKRTCLTFINSIINQVAAIRRHIKSFDEVDNPGHGFTSQKKIDDVL